MKCRSETWLLSVLVLLVAPTVAAAAIDPTAVDKTTASFRALEWWASLMPGTGNSHAYFGLAAFVLAIHVLQLPLVLKFRAAPRGEVRFLLKLALLFTECAPLAWAVINADASAVAFDADTKGTPVGLYAIPAVLGLASVLGVLVTIIGGVGSTFGRKREMGQGTTIFLGTFLLGPLISYCFFGALRGAGWIDDVGLGVGVFMSIFGVLPLSATVMIASERAHRR